MKIPRAHVLRTVATASLPRQVDLSKVFLPRSIFPRLINLGLCQAAWEELSTIVFDVMTIRSWRGAKLCDGDWPGR